MSTTAPIHIPADYVTPSAVAFADPAGRAVLASAAAPLPVTLVGGGRPASLQALRMGALPPIHPAPPRIVRRSSAAPLIDEADALVIDRRDPRITPCFAPLVQVAAGYPWDDFSRGGWIEVAAGEPPYAVTWGVRFVTDSPRVELRVIQPGDLRIRVDGMPLTPAASVTVPASDADGWVQPGIDFGDDTATIHPRVALANGGTGYGEGDLLAVAGAAGQPIVLAVTAVSATGAIKEGGLRVADWGTLTALDPGAVAAVGGSGSGAAVVLTDDLNGTPQRGHTTRRMRRVEVLFGGGITQIGDVRVTAGSTVRAWPFTGPRLMVMQDSYGQVYCERPDGQWPYRAAHRLGVEDVWLDTIGGTGLIAGSRRYADRLGEIAANLPEPGRAVIYLTQGSINDGTATPEQLRAAAEAYWRAAFHALPNDAVMVQTGILRAPGNNPSDAHSAALRDGFAAACAMHDPHGTRSGFIETRAPHEMLTIGGRAGAPTGGGATDHWISGDNAHLTQAGHDMVGDAFAARLLEIVRR